MDSFAVGDVVTVIFPYSDLSAIKYRPALIVGMAEFGNYITCQITSKAATSKRAIKLTDSDFQAGSLKVVSYIRPDKLFTLDPSLIQTKVGQLKRDKLVAVKPAIQLLFN